jgi:hypothetical protein
MGWDGMRGKAGLGGWGCREGVARGIGGDWSREIGVGVSKRNEVMFGVWVNIGVYGIGEGLGYNC